uniref:hypothetical protein n=1 Tax=Arthrobacter sp. TaxID=1667 RepID=UPI00159EDD30|nr:hypothetical protein [Arthrobacter sp.]
MELVASTYMMGIEAALALLNSAYQQSQALQVLLDSGRKLPLPAMGNVRAIHEVVLSLCWLYDPKVAAQERIVRSAALFLQAVQGGIPILKGFTVNITGSQRITTAMESRDGAIAALGSIGMVVKRKADDSGTAQNVRWGDYIANVVLKATDLSQKYAPKSHHVYAINSGAVHSQSWLTESMTPSWEVSLRSIVLPLFDLSDSMVGNLFGYLGLNADELYRNTHTRRIALMQDATEDGFQRADWRAYQANG